MNRSVVIFLTAFFHFFAMVGCHRFELLQWDRFDQLSRAAINDSQPTNDDLEVLISYLNQDAWQQDPKWTPLSFRHSKAKETNFQTDLRWKFFEGKRDGSGKNLEETLEAGHHQAPSSLINREEIKTKSPDPKPTRKEVPNKQDNKTTPDKSKTEEKPVEKKTTIRGQSSEESDDSHSAPQTPPSSPPDSENDNQTNWDGFWPLNPLQLLERNTKQDSLSGTSTDNDKYVEGLLENLSSRKDLVGLNAAILWAQRDPEAAASVIPILKNIATRSLTKKTNKKSIETEKDEQTRTLMSMFNRYELFSKFKTTSQPSSVKKSRSVKTSQAMQSAAAEAWCLVLAHQDGDPEELFAEAGTLLTKPKVPIFLRIELNLGIARRIQPKSIPRLANAFEKNGRSVKAPPIIRQAAIQSCVIHAINNTNNNEAVSSDKSIETDWPRSIWNCQFDEDSTVRGNYCYWLASIGHSKSFSIIKPLMYAREHSVREAAYYSLGLLKTDDALQELRKQASRQEVTLRRYSVRGLAFWGVVELHRFSQDESPLIRQTLAEELSNLPSTEAALLLQELLTDRNPNVQRTAVKNIREWPEELAVPLLLHGIQYSFPSVRNECEDILGSKIEFQGSIPVGASPQERAAALIKIVHESGLPQQLIDDIHQISLNTSDRVEENRKTEIRTTVETLLQSQPGDSSFLSSIDQLKQLQESELHVLEELLFQQSESLPEVFSQQILPTLHPVYKSLNELSQTDIFPRRRAASRISQLSQEGSLSPLMTRLLRLKLIHEQDQSVWQMAMIAVLPDGTDEATELARLAVNHVWPDLRVLGCQYIERHRKPETAPWLIPLFKDSNIGVQLAAIRAAGVCHNPVVLDGIPTTVSSGTPTSLRSLLTHTDQRVRFTAIESMSRLGDTQAIQELVLLSYHENSSTREQSVRLMGETGRTRFVEYLIRIAWTETNQNVKRALLTSLEQLVPESERSAGLKSKTLPRERIEVWVEWWNQKQKQSPTFELSGLNRSN